MISPSEAFRNAFILLRYPPCITHYLRSVSSGIGSNPCGFIDMLVLLFLLKHLSLSFSLLYLTLSFLSTCLYKICQQSHVCRPLAQSTERTSHLSASGI